MLELQPEEWKINLRQPFGTLLRHPGGAAANVITETRAIGNIYATAGFIGALVTRVYSAITFMVMGLTKSLIVEVRKQNIK